MWQQMATETKMQTVTIKQRKIGPEIKKYQIQQQGLVNNKQNEKIAYIILIALINHVGSGK
jgi:hypothetical protein